MNNIFFKQIKIKQLNNNKYYVHSIKSDTKNHLDNPLKLKTGHRKTKQIAYVV